MRFLGNKISPDTTNINTTKTISYYSLTSGNSYTQARIYNSGDKTNGVWYNFAAASAMTITGDSNSNNAVYSLCPAGWRLPSKDEADGMVEHVDELSLNTGAWWRNKKRQTGARWNLATAYSATARYYFYYSGSVMAVGGNSLRDNGYHIRCIRSS